MITQEDLLQSFIPKNKTNFIILGTMVAMNGRTINGIQPKDDYFYYNNNRNHFWRVLQYLVSPKIKKNEVLNKLSINEKKDFLNKNGISIINLVQNISIPNSNKLDPSDTVLFDAHKKKKLKFKSLSNKEKSLIKSSPIFFTCRKKKGIDLLIDGFLNHNNLDINLKSNIWFWPTPTRCNPYDRSQIWREEMNHFLKFTK